MSSSYLSKSVTPSTATSYTVSFWFKVTNTNQSSGTPYLWSCGSTSGGAQGIYYNVPTNLLRYYGHTSYTDAALSEGALRDTNAWYNIVWSVNAGTGTSYLNGVQQGSTISNVAPLNAHTGDLMAINSYAGGLSTYDDGGFLMSHFHFVDGTAYPASTFGSTDSVTGQWKINTSPSLSYGTNGFFLFKDNASVNDQSGNGNNFTASGTVTQTEDCPSNVFATMNPLTKGVSASAYPSFANGNTTITNTVRQHGFSSLGVSSGKWYTEFKITSGATSSVTGISDGSYTTYLGYGTGDYSYRGSDGTWYNNQSATSYGSALSDNDIVGVALDLDNNKLYFSINGTFQNSGDPTSGSSGTGAISISAPATGFYHFATGNILTSGTITAQSNFGNGFFGTTQISSEGTNASGNGKFEYDVPTGYTALSTKGLNL